MIPVLPEVDGTMDVRYGRGRHARFWLAILLTAAIIGPLLVSPPARAGINSWTRIGPDGGSIKQLVIHPQSPAVIYAITDHYLYRSSNSGTSWSLFASGLEGREMYTLVIDPATPTTLYVGTDDGLYKTVNGGTNWSRLNQEFWSTDIRALAIAPSSSTTLYVGTAFNIYRSDNSGSSWVELTRLGLFGGAKVLAVDPTNAQIVYAVAFGDDRLYKTLDGGTSWNAANTGLPTDQTMTSVVINPQAPATLYAILNASGAIYKSTNGGGIWNLANTNVNDQWPHAIALDPQQPSTLYLQAGGDVYKSTNEADTWQLSEAGMEQYTINTIAVDPTASARVYAGSTGHGVFKSTDGGANWNWSSSGIQAVRVHRLAFGPQSPPRLYATSNESGLFTSPDNGATWSRVSQQTFFSQFVVNPRDPTVLYAGDSTGLRKSSDGGSTWDIVLDVACDFVFCYYTPISDIALDPQNPSNVYASYGTTRRQGVYRSTTAGLSWQKRSVGTESNYVYELALDPQTPATIYAGTENGIYKSTDGAERWVAANSGIPAGTAITHLEVASSDPQTLYASDGIRLYRSINGATSWTEVLRPGEVTSLDTILIDSASATTLYVVVSNNVYRSSDSGANWTLLNPLPTSLSITSLALHPANPNMLYAGTAGSSIHLYEIVVQPTINSQPIPQTISAGQQATLNVAATDTTSLSYQWYRGTSGDTSNPIIGATNPSFTTPPLEANTSYWVRVANASGVTTDSAAATIIVVTGFELAVAAQTQADKPLTVTVRARDSGGSIAPGYRGTVRITSSDGQATLPPNYTFTSNDGGIRSFTLTLHSPGQQTITIADSTSPSVHGSATIRVNVDSQIFTLYLPIVRRLQE